MFRFLIYTFFLSKIFVWITFLSIFSSLIQTNASQLDYTSDQIHHDQSSEGSEALETTHLNELTTRYDDMTTDEEYDDDELTTTNENDDDEETTLVHIETTELPTTQQPCKPIR